MTYFAKIDDKKYNTRGSVLPRISRYAGLEKSTYLAELAIDLRETDVEMIIPAFTVRKKQLNHMESLRHPDVSHEQSQKNAKQTEINYNKLINLIQSGVTIQKGAFIALYRQTDPSWNIRYVIIRYLAKNYYQDKS